MSLIRLFAAAASAVCALTLTPPPAAANPLSDCASQSADTIAARACLRERLETANATLSARRAAVREAARAADAAQGRDVAVRRAEAAELAFEAFRTDACRLEAALAASDGDVGAWEVACAIARTEARVQELERLLERDPPPPATVAGETPPAEPSDPPQPRLATLLSGASAETFRDWRVACIEDACHVGAFAQGEAPLWVLVLTRRSGDESWRLALGALEDDIAAERVSLQIDGAAARELAVTLQGDHAALSVAPDAFSQLMRQLRGGAASAVTVDEPGGETRSARFSLMGMTAAMNAAAAYLGEVR